MTAGRGRMRERVCKIKDVHRFMACLVCGKACTKDGRARSSEVQAGLAALSFDRLVDQRQCIIEVSTQAASAWCTQQRCWMCEGAETWGRENRENIGMEVMNSYKAELANFVLVHPGTSISLRSKQVLVVLVRLTAVLEFSQEYSVSTSVRQYQY
eukprot:900258-Rhodomonas_salina.2